MAKIPFYKMTGCGNDFIIIDNRQKILDADRLGPHRAFPESEL
jgi:diaminopimelate epimerase